jgi:hypothetical protein
MRHANDGDLRARLTRLLGDARPHLAAATKLEVPASPLDGGRLPVS